MSGITVIAGSARGRRLRTPPGLAVRPILARIKKSLFDILRPRIAGTAFLDVFAGTGAVGIEALSQGAARAVFVEKDSVCVKIIENNLAALGFAAQGRVMRWEAMGALRVIEEKFDLIFLGPPYVVPSADKPRAPLSLTTPALEAIAAHGRLAAGGWVIAQHHAKEVVPEAVGTLARFRQERYGDSRLSFYAVA